LASLGHYPAIDVLESISRLKKAVTTPEHYTKELLKIQEIIATYREAEDLISVGAYQKGTNKKIDRAIASIDRINDFLTQDINETDDFGTIIEKLSEIADD
jgi:flagellum-specific ATP synthase